VKTGVANTASVMTALTRLGAEPREVEDADTIRRAARIVLPGVGAFGPAMKTLRERGWDGALRARIADDRPTLAICLGFQLLGGGSQESPGIRGLEVFSATARRFEFGESESGRATPRVPHLGWNQVRAQGCEGLWDGEAYFAHSYYLSEVPAGWRAAWTTHGHDFIAALQRGRVLACQFHPELSGAWGRQLLTDWLERGETAC
jgi:imidazole glycerol phosphate synthase glutamine amidotransferase subunit